MKKIFSLICLLGLSLAGTPLLAQTRVSVADFGARPSDGKDDTKALRAAAEYCRNHPGTTLFFPEGEYILRDKEAIALEERTLRGENGANPERVMFTPYPQYVKGLDFSGSEGITVLAHKAKLVCEGWMEPVSIEDCRNFTLKGLTIDYLRKPFSHGIVTAVDSASFDVLFSDEQQVSDVIPMLRLTFWMPLKDRIFREPIYFPKRELLGGNKIRFHHTVPQELVRATAQVVNTFHFRPAILIQRSGNTLIEDVTILSQPGMGITGFDSRDILLRRLIVRPAEGYHQSTNTDATHFASCEGLLRFENCFFEGNGDDVTNVHGYYQTITEAEGSRATVQVKAPTFTHTQIIDAPRPGDTLELVKKSTLEPVRKYAVTASETDRPSLSTRIGLSDTLPADFGNYFLMDVTKLPRLEFVNNTVNSHLSRGMLAKTRNVLIEGNTFLHTSGTAIHVGAESWWSEGSHAENVVIRGNTITGCGQGIIGTMGEASAIAVMIEAEDTGSSYLHKDIRIENNRIIGEGDKRAIFIGNADGVVLSGNHITGYDEKCAVNSSTYVVFE